MGTNDLVRQLDRMLGVTCGGLASHPARVVLSATPAPVAGLL